MAAGVPPRARVDAVRAEMAAAVARYRALVGAASKASGASLPRIDAALAEFEPVFFGNLLVALDARFPGRAPGTAGVFSEVRALCDALVHHGGRLVVDPAEPYDGDAALLRLEPGDRVELNGDDFEALCTAFLDALAAAGR